MSRLVTVGVPTYNRPEPLRRALESLLAQTYEDLEIVISDNCSTDAEVESVGREFAAADARVRYIRQEENLGAQRNYLSVLAEAKGEYFMWAADDDRWEPFFASTLVEALDALGEGFIGAAMEAQYEVDGKAMPFFPEGRPFYEFESDDAATRCAWMLDHAYGDLVYGLFRTTALRQRGNVFYANEIPFLLSVASAGNLRVLPRAGLHKATTDPTYQQARWEMEGGRKPGFPGLRNHLRSLPGLARYHRQALTSITETIDDLPLTEAQRKRLRAQARKGLNRHMLQLAVGYKKS